MFTFANQQSTCPSSLPAAKSLPFGEKQRHLTQLLFLLFKNIFVFELTCQMTTVPSSEPLFKKTVEKFHTSVYDLYKM
jgi:hypothetical protein